MLTACCLARAFGLETGGANDITSVSARASDDYVRLRQADGRFAGETYAFGKGGNWPGGQKDASIDKLTFLDVAHAISGPLASQNYHPARDPATTRLLIMLYWGTTQTPAPIQESPAYTNLQNALSDPVLRPFLDQFVSAVAAENHMRDKADIQNVKMLGYESWWLSSEGDNRGTALESKRRDLVAEIEDERYFVVLMAYDFQLLRREKKHKLLWETRFSIRQRHHAFDQDLPALAQYASRYFGQDSGGLVHGAVPLGQVNIGEVKSLGELGGK